MAYEEREIKLYVQDLEGLVNRTRICGGELVRPRVFERNVRLDTDERSLQAGGRLLRLREDDQVRVTYKENARLEDGVITRTEIEFSADDADAVRKLFKALGYQEVVVYEKYRQVYQLGDVQVMLDELPFGDFVEIEAPNNILIEGMVQMLGLDGSRAVKTNYLGLWEIVKRRTGLAVNDLTFENLEGITLTHEDLGVLPADRP
jgi:adenylate cyclase class 2